MSNSEPDGNKSVSQVQPPAPPNFVSMTQVSVFLPLIPHEPEPVHMYWLREDQIDALSSEFNSLSVAPSTTMMGLCFGALTTLASASLSDRAYAAFIGTAITTGMLALFFGGFSVKGLLDRRSLKNRVKRTQAVNVPSAPADVAST